MIPIEYFQLIQKEGHTLADVGVHGYGLSRQMALKALRILQKSQIAVLGGDVYKIIHGKLTVTHDNWFCQQEDYDTQKKNITKSIMISEQYISKYNDSEDNNIFYKLVIQDDGKIEYSYYCPVCGYELDFLPWKGDNPSDERCPCCYIQFGYDDFGNSKDYETKIMLYNEWRNNWIAKGMPWNLVRIKPPLNWEPKKQLQNIGIFIK